MRKIFHLISIFILMVNIILTNFVLFLRNVFVILFFLSLYSCKTNKVENIKHNTDNYLVVKKNELVVKEDIILESVKSTINYYNEKCNQFPSYILLSYVKDGYKFDFNLDCFTYDNVLFEIEPFKYFLNNSDGVFVINNVLVICKFPIKSNIVEYKKNKVDFLLKKTNEGCYLIRSYSVLNEKINIEYENFIFNVRTQ